jgi:predicted peptidase
MGRTKVFVVSAQAPAEQTISADSEIKGLKVHAFVDIDGAKTDAIIVEYADDVVASSVSAQDYKITDYATFLAAQGTSFERGDTSTAGTIERVYVNDKAEPASGAGTKSGRYVIIEVNTDYMLAGNTPKYTTTLMAGVTQTGKVQSTAGIVTPSTAEKGNYTTSEQDKYNREGEYEGKETVITTDSSTFLIPQLSDASGWDVGKTFHATNCYSEYDGKTYDFDFPYSIYVPELTEADKGKVAVDLHIEDAGTLGTDPMYALTESQGPVDLASSAVQDKQKMIVIVPQVEESRRAADDYVATSEMNPAFWELLDSVISEYADYVNTDQIYGTGQSMGGMTLMDMAEQRDNFFAGFLIFGSQWSNSYNKDSQHNGAAARNGDNDTVTFTADYPYTADVDNWYYQISDDNVMVLNCTGDLMSYSLWSYTQEYFTNAGVEIPHDQWFASASIADQNDAVSELAQTTSSLGIRWGSFRGGDHMSTWKYGYDLDSTYTWLISQTRTSENNRGKIEALNEQYEGRDSSGKLISTGTKNMNSAQYTPGGADSTHAEGWTPGE